MDRVSAAFKAEVKLWNNARQGHVGPLTVFSRLFPFPFLISAALKLFTGSASPIQYPLLTTTACWAAAVGFLLPTMIVALLDMLYDVRAWTRFGPCQLNKHSTSEHDHCDRFVRHPMSCYSSHAQTAAGAFILARACTDARAPLASGVFGLATIAIGLVSFGWWASRRHAIQRADSFLMEVVTVVRGVAALAVGVPDLEAMIIVAFVVYVVWRAATFVEGCQANFLYPTIFYTGAYLVCTQLLGGCGLVWRYTASTGAIYLGFVLKFCDTTGRGAWGTAAFHYCLGFADPLLWLWTQSWPAAGAVGAAGSAVV